MHSCTKNIKEGQTGEIFFGLRFFLHNIKKLANKRNQSKTFKNDHKKSTNPKGLVLQVIT
jgi:hypothetical protein